MGNSQDLDVAQSEAAGGSLSQASEGAASAGECQLGGRGTCLLPPVCCGGLQGWQLPRAIPTPLSLSRFPVLWLHRA